MEIQIRPETPADYAAIDLVNDLAFQQKAEGELVRMLRKREDFIPALSLVALHEDRVIGHVLFSPIRIVFHQKSHPSIALAPISVLPEFQNQKVGSRLIRHGLEAVLAEGYQSVIVLGYPKYYPLFGFRPASAWNIKAPFDIRDELFMAMELVEGSLNHVRGVVEYPPEFMEA